MMMMKILLLSVLTLLTGVRSIRPEEIYVKAGEMVVLHCPHYIGLNPNDDTKPDWTSYTTKGMFVIDNITSAEQKILIRGRSLVILIASLNHQGNYSCSLGNASSHFRLTVHTKQSADDEKKDMYSVICYMQESCTLNCPDVNIPAVNTPNITSKGIIWHKQGELLPKDSYFSSVEKEDHGVYVCTRSYLYDGQLYNMSFTVLLDVQPQGKSGKPMILSPSKTDVFYVDLGSTVVIDCKAVVYSDFDEVFWLSDKSFVEMNDSLPVFYNYTSEENSEEINIAASLIIKKVSEEDLSRHYTCKLDSVSLSSFITITLVSKAQPFSPSMPLSIVGILVLITTIAIAVYLKFKINITLLLRDTFGCHSSTSDGKNYDAFLMCYESETDAGLNEDNRQCLESVLEKRFGYSLCLYDSNVKSRRAEAEVLLDCIEQSRTVVLVPTSADYGLKSDVLNDIHTALEEQKNNLVLIKTQTKVNQRLPEGLELLGKAVVFVTWTGTSSLSHSSSFFKQLRYYLSAPRHQTKVKLLPHSNPV